MTDKPKKQNPIVKTALEMGPLAVFFLTFVRAPAMELGGRTYEPIVLATAGFMIATAISLSVSYALYRKLPVMPMVTGVIVFIFGGLTIYLNDETFIKLKPTIVNLLFCGTLLIGMMFGKSFLKTVLGETIDIDDEGWRKLTLRWGLYFGFLAILNEVVWRNFTTDTWVWFKTFGVLPITLVFAMSMIPLMNAHMIEEDEDEEAAAEKV